MRKIRSNNQGSIYPVIVFILVIAVASFIILLFNEIYTPFYQLMNSGDTSMDTAFDSVRTTGMGFINLIWPKGILLGIIIITGFGVIMEYHKSKYQVG